MSVKEKRKMERAFSRMSECPLECLIRWNV